MLLACLTYRDRFMNQFSFSDIVKFTNDIVIVTTVDDPKIVYVNKAFETLTGYSSEDVMGLSPRILQGPGTSEKTRQKIREALSKKEPVRAEILNYSKKRGEYWLDLQIFPLKDQNGNVSYFAAIERDITERLNNEQKIKESEARLRSIISGMSEGIVVQDKSGFIETCNDAAESILGLSKDQMMGRTSIDSRWMSVHEDGSPFPGNEHPSMVTLKTGESQNNVIMGVRKPDETSTWISINTRPIYVNQSEAPDAVVATFHDITAQTVANQLKSEFISTVSHELRTPLTSIRGSLGLLNGGVVSDLPSSALDILNVASRNCERLIELINDLLDFDKLSAGEMELDIKAVSLNEILKQALDSNQPYAEKYEVEFVLPVAKASLVVEVDEGRILQVLANFMSNAAKFSPKNSKVFLDFEPLKGDRVKVIVKDCGQGIPKEFENRIFDRFSQADSGVTRNQGGTGLGLAISKALIERHNGDIGFTNNEPQGSIFYFIIPLKQIDGVV